MRQSKFVLTAAVAIAACWSASAVAAGSRPLEQYCFDGAPPQKAAGEDIHVFDPYIGRFRGATQRDDTGGKEFYFVVEFSWFSPEQTVVRFRVDMVVIGEDGERRLGEGYYGYDAFNERLYVLGVFRPGVSGFGAVGSFDRDTHRRSTWACQVGPSGERTYVRDEFEIVDANSWRNVTRVRRGEGGAWTVVTDEVLTRIAN